MVGQIRLLIADDSYVVRHAICALLKNEPGIAITGEARNYTELLEMVSKSSPHVVLLDLRMPDENRFAPDTIKAKLSGSCVLAMSVFADDNTASLAKNYGAITLLDKTTLASSLIPAIEEWTAHIHGKGC